MTIAEKLTQIAENEQKVYEAGAQAEYDAFWDSIQAYGTKTRYERTFEYTQWDKPFNPKYSLGSATMTANIFNKTKVGDNLYTDKLDFSKSASLNCAFMYSDVTRLKRIDARATLSGYNGGLQMFALCYYLKEITEFYPPVNTGMESAFWNCYELETINFCSEIVNGLNLQYSAKLSRASIESVINALSADASDLTVTLSATAVNTAFETAEGLADGSVSDAWLALIATKANWTISLV